MWKGWYFQIKSNRLVSNIGPVLGLGKNALAFSIWPCILLKKNLAADLEKELLNHEKIHLKQQIELLVFFMWLLYIAEYIYALVFLQLTKRQAYYYISFEQEAHINAPDFSYLKNRKFFASFSYLKNKKDIRRNEEGTLIIENRKKIT